MSQILEPKEVDPIVDNSEENLKPPVNFVRKVIHFAGVEEFDIMEENEEQTMVQHSFGGSSVEVGEYDEHEVKQSSFDAYDSEISGFSCMAVNSKSPATEKATNFFYSLGQVPNSDEISSSESSSLDVTTDSIEEVDEDASQEASEDIVEKYIKEEESSTQYSELNYKIESSGEDELIQNKEKSDEDIFELLVKQTVEVFEIKDPELEARQLARIRLKSDVSQFLSSLVGAVVEMSEHVDPKAVLCRKMDKVKLFRELVRSIDELNSESKITDFLSNKCVQYYKRARDFRRIAPEDEQVSATEKEQYEGVLSKLNCLLGSKTVGNEIQAKRIHEAKTLKAELEERAKLSYYNLESVMRKILSTKHNDALKRFLDPKIEEIKNLRGEILSVRQVLIERQHVSGTLLEEMFDLGNITDVLHLDAFESILGEEHALQKKIEEKSDRLLNMFHTFSSYTHIVAHIREYQIMFLHALCTQSKALKAANIQKQNLRSQIHKLRLNRMNIKKDIVEKNSALGSDIDETVEDGQRMKVKVEAVKAKIQRLENRIEFLQKHTDS